MTYTHTGRKHHARRHRLPARRNSRLRPPRLRVSLPVLSRLTCALYRDRHRQGRELVEGDGWGGGEERRGGWEDEEVVVGDGGDDGLFVYSVSLWWRGVTTARYVEGGEGSGTD